MARTPGAAGQTAPPPRGAANLIDGIEGYDPVTELGVQTHTRDGHRGWFDRRRGTRRAPDLQSVPIPITVAAVAWG